MRYQFNQTRFSSDAKAKTHPTSRERVYSSGRSRHILLRVQDAEFNHAVCVAHGEVSEMTMVK
jgi:hypothetical protein